MFQGISRRWDRCLIFLGVVVGLLALTTTPLGGSSGSKPGGLFYKTAAASRGATLPYTEYFAQDAATNGSILGSSRKADTLAGEASGRSAVQLNSQGQYVQFTLAQAANAVSFRYSIPDSSDGSGLTAPLALYVNGAFKQSLTLTSKYSWFYGGYPFTNNPGDNPHHFYDEVRLLLGSDLPAGSTVKLQIDSGDNAPWYVINLADFYQVAAPLSEPAGFLSVTDFGADPTGAADSTQAVQNAVNAGENQGKGVWIPSGTFTVNNHVIVDKVTLEGAGPWYSTLHGNGVGVYGNYPPNGSTNVHLSDFAIQGEVTDRNDGAQVNGVGGAIGGGSVISDLWIEHTKVGMWFDGPFDGLVITGNTIRDTTADGINLHQGITNVTIEQNNIRNVGDDGIALWSQNNPDANDLIQFNTVELPILANNIAIYGGHDNSITDNIVSDTQTQGGGIHVGNRFGSVPLAGVTTITRNTLLRTGVLDPNWQFGVGALWFYALDSAMSGQINVTDEEVDDSSYEAIQFVGSTITNISFDRININGAGTYAVQIQSAGSATFNNVVANNLGLAGYYDCGSGLTMVQGTGNSGWANNKYCGAWLPPVYHQNPSPTPTQVFTTPTPGVTPTPIPTPTPTPSPTPTPVGNLVKAINAGGGTVGNYQADSGFDQGNQFSDTSTPINSGTVTNPPPQAVLQTVRWSPNFTYTIPGLTSGASYSLRLDWAELSFQQSGMRVFNVAVNGNPVLSNFDVFAAAGYKTAISKSFPVQANSQGQIVVAFTRGPADNPFINALEVWQAGTPSPLPTPSVCAPQTAPAPVGVTATAGASGSMNVSWTAGAGNACQPAPQFFAIYAFSYVGTPQMVLTANPNSLLVSGLPTGDYYTFTVTAYNAAGWGAWSNWSSWALAT